jgi:hypothetical protein
VGTSAKTAVSRGRMVVAAVLAIIAVAFIVAGIALAILPEGQLPGILGHVDGSTQHRPLRAVGSLLVAAVFVVGAWFALMYQRPSDEDTDSDSDSGLSTPAPASN